jgi:hypothetical protein
MNLRRREPVSAWWAFVVAAPLGVVALAAVVTIWGPHR